METPNNIERSAQSFAAIIKYLGIISAAIIGCYVLLLFTDDEGATAVTLLTYGVVGLLSTFTIYYLIMLLVNISLKFDNIAVNIDSRSMDKLRYYIEKSRQV